jgi:hypothetical protein
MERVHFAPSLATRKLPLAGYPPHRSAPMWVKRFESSELTPDVIAAMKSDGLTVADEPGAHRVTVTTDKDWMANKWGMSKRIIPAGGKDTFLDQLAKIGAWNFTILFILAVLAVASLLWRDRQ